MNDFVYYFFYICSSSSSSGNRSSCRSLHQLWCTNDEHWSLQPLHRHGAVHRVQEMEVNVRICQVYRHFCANSFNQHQFLYHNPTPIAYTYLTTDCCLSVLQACSKKRKSPRITRAVDIIAEVQLPTTTTDTTFDSFIRRNTEQIMQIVNEHHQRHGCVICLSISNEI